MVELLVVVSIITMLIAIMLPAMVAAREQARRTVCASNMRQIAVLGTVYASENFGAYFSPYYNGGGAYVQHGFNAAGVERLYSVGLALGPKQQVIAGHSDSYLPAPVWNCPSRRWVSQWDPQTLQMFVAAQWFGGIPTWFNSAYHNVPSRSPIRVQTSRGDWVLVTDSTMKIDRAWGGGRAIFGDMPSHKAGGKASPAGQNQAYVDGSVSWVDVSKLLFVQSWVTDGTRNCYMWQSDLGTLDPSKLKRCVDDP